jgi:alkylhydroperoxidase family enzyme
MARIPYYELKDTDTDKTALLGRAPKLNVMRIMAHATYPVLEGFVGLVASILGAGRLDPSLRELAIIRTGILCGSEYEVFQHTKMARRMAMPEEKIEALSVGSSSPAFTDVERLVLKFTEEIVLNRKAGEETFRAVEARLSHEEMVELTIAIGCYVMVSSLLMTFEVDIERKP